MINFNSFLDQTMQDKMHASGMNTMLPVTYVCVRACALAIFEIKFMSLSSKQSALAVS